MARWLLACWGIACTACTARAAASTNATQIVVDFGAFVGPATRGLPTYLDQVNPGTMGPAAPIRDAFDGLRCGYSEARYGRLALLRFILICPLVDIVVWIDASSLTKPVEL